MASTKSERLSKFDNDQLFTCGKSVFYVSPFQTPSSNIYQLSLTTSSMDERWIIDVKARLDLSCFSSLRCTSADFLTRIWDGLLNSLRDATHPWVWSSALTSANKLRCRSVKSKNESGTYWWVQKCCFLAHNIWISCNKHGCKTSQHLVRNNLTTLTNVETQSGTVVPGLAAVRQLIEHMYCEQTYVTWLKYPQTQVLVPD